MLSFCVCSRACSTFAFQRWCNSQELELALHLLGKFLVSLRFGSNTLGIGGRCRGKQQVAELLPNCCWLLPVGMVWILVRTPFFWGNLIFLRGRQSCIVTRISLLVLLFDPVPACLFCLRFCFVCLGAFRDLPEKQQVGGQVVACLTVLAALSCGGVHVPFFLAPPSFRAVWSLLALVVSPGGTIGVKPLAGALLRRYYCNGSCKPMFILFFLVSERSGRRKPPVERSALYILVYDTIVCM